MHEQRVHTTLLPRIIMCQNHCGCPSAAHRCESLKILWADQHRKISRLGCAAGVEREHVRQVAQQLAKPSHLHELHWAVTRHRLACLVPGDVNWQLTQHMQEASHNL